MIKKGCRLSFIKFTKIKQISRRNDFAISKGIDFNPGELLDVSGELGLRKFLESNGHTLVVTSDKDAKAAKQIKNIDADIVISQPF